MKEKKTWVVLDPSGLPVTQPADNAWDAIDQLNISMEDEWADYKAKGYKLISQDNPIHFTPGVPTGDGWYVVKFSYNRVPDLIGLPDDPPKELYHTVNVFQGDVGYDRDYQVIDDVSLSSYTILSHAKLPEL